MSSFPYFLIKKKILDLSIKLSWDTFFREKNNFSELCWCMGNISIKDVQRAFSELCKVNFVQDTALGSASPWLSLSFTGGPQASRCQLRLMCREVMCAKHTGCHTTDAHKMWDMDIFLFSLFFIFFFSSGMDVIFEVSQKWNHFQRLS